MRIRNPLHRFLLAFVFTLFLPPLQAATFTDLFVFGDSLSDTTARITNGDLWPEYLSADLGIPYHPAHNFAVAGATTQDMVNRQLTAWQSAYTVDTNALYVIWGGPNDVFNGLSPLGTVGNLVNLASTLEAAGARHVVMLNLPDLGMTPRARSAGLSAQATYASQSINALLATQLAAAGLRTQLIDVFGWMQAIKADPALFGFTNIASSCTDDGQTPACAGYLFYDDIHPTTAAHALIAEVIGTTVVPLPAALWLFVSGLGMLGVRAMRRR